MGREKEQRKTCQVSDQIKWKGEGKGLTFTAAEWVFSQCVKMLFSPTAEFTLCRYPCLCSLSASTASLSCEQVRAERGGRTRRIPVRAWVTCVRRNQPCFYEMQISSPWAGVAAPKGEQAFAYRKVACFSVLRQDTEPHVASSASIRVWIFVIKRKHR